MNTTSIVPKRFRDSLTFVWEDDWEIDNHAAEFDCYDDGGPFTCERCIVRDELGHVVAALGCVDDADEDYRREIESELALEAFIDALSSPAGIVVGS